MGMTILAGRTFDQRDVRPGTPAPVVVNETFANTFFPGMNAIGQHYDNASESDRAIPNYEIVGIVADSKYRSLREGAFPAVFNCLRTPDDLPDAPFQLLIRTFEDPKSVIASMGRTLRGLDPALPFSEVHTLSEEIDISLWPEHMLVRLGLLVSGIATLLAAIGLYGLLSYVVAERRREIGVRLALGAGPFDIAQATALRTCVVVGIGIGAGLASSIATATLLRGLLFDVSPWNVGTLAVSAGFVIFCSGAAIVLPIARATRLEPGVALRYA
jgi:hypothetical protein